MANLEVTAKLLKGKPEGSVRDSFTSTSECVGFASAGIKYQKKKSI